MEKKIKKRAPLYGIAAVLLAIVLAAACYNFGVYLPESGSPEGPSPASGLLNTFSSYEELRSFLTANSETQGAYPFYGPWDSRIMGEALEGVPAKSAPGLEFEYSTTNIQVTGVDEADIVKTDGKHIYLVSGNSVFILKAHPTEKAEVLSNITFGDTYPVGIFVSQNRLAVLGCKYTVPSWDYYSYYCVDVETFVNLYDISNKTNPTFLKDFTISGSYFNSRRIGEYVYFVASQPTYIIYDTVILPKIYSKNGIKEISASEIHYFNGTDNYYVFTTIVALNMQNTEEEPTRMTIMLGGTSSMYVSLNNLYITFPEPYGQTSIYRIHIENSTLNCEAKGKVRGRELNQFSMDEYDNYFRIATTTWVNGNTQNNLYILDMNLTEVGKLENITLAFNERIDSARFMGNRCYLATSVVQRDPFFVIDVENASEPKILGYLKIPGFTRYLHPYNENHVIGIGKDENNKVKISVFDVTNVTAPKNMTEYKVEGAWSDTLVLTEHKAFLFDRSKDLLVIPVSTYEEDRYSLWQGAYVFNVTLSDLFLRGNVTHQENGVNGWESSYWVKRTLYIEDVLYTVSDKKIKMNSLEDLAFLNEIELP
jgi:inhibitor of cysteine peptidase